MRDKSQFQRWCPAAEELVGLDPVRARDIVVKCFFEAQRETIASAKKSLGMPATDAEIRASAEGALRMAFAKVGADYDAPTKESLRAAVGSLVETSRAFGTPADIVAHHVSIIEGILARL